MTAIHINTKRKDLPVHGLEKVPDEVIIAKLRIELGQLNSYIDELEEEIEILKQSKDPDVSKLENEIKSLKGSLKQIREQNRILIYEEKIKKKDKEISNLRKTVSDLVAKQYKQ